MTDPDVFFNGDDAWAITEEAYGPGVDGQRILSPARYTYAVLPGQTDEQFVAVRAYKPLARGRGIGFSGWLAASNEPADFGQADGFCGSRRTATRHSTRSTRSRPTSHATRICRRRSRPAAKPSCAATPSWCPSGKGLLYVQPLYLDAQGDSLPIALAGDRELR